jgi:diguanylate cyclase (GGDEF)-like protein
VGAGLAIRFQRSGALLGLVALGAAGSALYVDGPAGGLQAAVAVLLPVNLLALAVLPERGLTGTPVLRRTAAVLAQALVLLVLVRTGQLDLLTPLARRTLTAPLLPLSAPAGDLAALAAATAMAALAIVLLVRPDPVTRGFLWAIAGGFLAFAAAPGDDLGGFAAQTFLLTAAALALVVALVEAAHALAYQDALTGLPNRRALEDALRRLRGPFAVAMADVDHFKAVNDTHGHEVGDQILRLVASHLTEIGEGGRAFRYGGEEFAILFPGRTAADVAATLEGIRAAVEAATFTLRAADRPRRRPKQPRRRKSAQQLAVTISLGVAHHRPGDSAPDAVVQRADGALYRAKERGRNRVASAEAGRGG